MLASIPRDREIQREYTGRLGVLDPAHMGLATNRLTLDS